MLPGNPVKGSRGALCRRDGSVDTIFKNRIKIVETDFILSIITNDLKTAILELKSFSMETDES